MANVSELLASKKDRSLHTIAPTTTVFEAVELMAAKQVGAVLVMQDEQLVGIVTERDYARKIALQSRASRTTLVRDIMSTPVIHVAPGDGTDHCLVLMAQNQLRHLPVLDNGKLVGMVSIRDLVDEIVADRRVLIEEIEQAVEQRSGTLAEPSIHADP